MARRAVNLHVCAPHSFGLLRSPALTKWHAAVERPTAARADILRPVASATATGDPGRCGGFRGAGGHSFIESYVEECPTER